MNTLDYLKNQAIFGTQSSAISLVSGFATLVGGTVTVPNTSVSTTSKIFLTAQSGTLNTGDVSVSTRVNGVSFTITSLNILDARQIAYLIL